MFSDIALDTAVVTTTYVTRDRLPILYVTHELGEEGEPVWQFHAGNADFDMSRMQLVSLKTILKADPSVADVSDLPLGFAARRTSKTAPWIYEREAAES